MSTDVMVEVFFAVSETGAAVFTLNSPSKGELDNTDFKLADEVVLSPTVVTESAYAASTTRGRNRELDVVDAGSCEVLLRNYDARWLTLDLNDSRLYTESGEIITDEDGAAIFDESGTYNGNVAIGKRVRVSVEGVTIFDGIIDDYQFTYSQYGEVDASFTAFDALASLARKRLDEWATTASDTPGERIADLLDRPEVNYPSNRSIDNGTAELQGDTVDAGTSVLEYGQDVARSDMGTLFADREGVLTFRGRRSAINPTSKVTFADDGGGVPFISIGVASTSDLLANRVEVERVNGVAQIAEDLASQDDEIGVRFYGVNGLLLSDDTQSLSMAEFLLSVYKHPAARVRELRVALDDLTSAQRADVLSLDVADAVTLTWTPTGATSTYSRKLIVEGVSHSLGVDSLHTATFALSNVAQDAIFILDDTVDGLLDSGVLTF